MTTIDYDAIPSVEIIGGDRFQLEHELGRGGRAVVWKAKELEEPLREIAVKVITCPFDSVERGDVLKQFENEARIWSQFQKSPQVVQLYYTFRQHVKATGGDLLAIGFVMEYSPDGDLKKLLRNKKPLTETLSYDKIKIRRFLLDIAQSIKAGHDLGVIHRDIKASNVIIFQQGPIKIPKMMDFGISWPLEKGAAKFAGTFEYMSPEIFEKKPATEASDIYSLGVLFVEILTGKLPYELGILSHSEKVREYGKAHNRKDEFETRFNKTIDTIKKQDDSLGTLVQEMMALEPTKRPNIGKVIRRLQQQVDVEITAAKTTTHEPRISENFYRWNPHVHEAVGDQLKYYFIKGKSPIGDPSWISNNLRDRGVTGFSIYRIVGGYDYILRAWANTIQEAQVMRTLADFRTFHNGSFQQFNVKEIHLLASQEVKDIDIKINVDNLLQRIVDSKNSEPAVEAKNLASKSLIFGKFYGQTSQKYPMRVFLTVQAAGRPTDFMMKSCAKEFADTFVKEKNLIKDLSVYRGDGDFNLLLKFRLKKFEDLACVYHKYLTIAAVVGTENYVLSSQTFIEIAGFEEFNESARLVESDDGSIVSSLNRFNLEVTNGSTS